MPNSLIVNEFDLPFDYHYCPSENGKRGAALVFTTELADHNDLKGLDRQQCDVLAVLEADNADLYGDTASELAEFVTDALNAYVTTEAGMRHWKKVHGLITVMRNSGRQ